MKNDKLKINFNAGPAALPLTVIEAAAQAILNYNDTGLSILSIPHRGKLFDDILEESKSLVKELCGLNDDYEILWMHGGGRLQFCMIPMNFLGEHETAGYIDSGFWAADAADYAKYYGNVAILSSSKENNYVMLPEWPGTINKELAYLHFTTNNTIYGTQWKQIPQCEVPLVADMSSDIFSRQMKYSHCDMFYAVAQKNLGHAGVTLVVIKKDLLHKGIRVLSPILDYAAHAKKNSVLNTPPVFAIYTSLLMLRWTKERGIDNIEKENSAKAKLLHDEIERNTLFVSHTDKESRSMMNVCFTVHNKEHEKQFALYCEERNIVNVEGHRSVGAFRVSLYNAITLQDVECLVSVMQEFEKAVK